MTYEPQCHLCVHFHLERATREHQTCAAFATQIPAEILENRHDHHRPYPGDHGIRFEPIDRK